MSKKLEELSKEELLSLIKHNLPTTLFDGHPCFCASCGTENDVKPINVESRNGWLVVDPLCYLCDECQKL